MKSLIFYVALAGLAIYFALKETGEIDRDFYRCYLPIYSAALEEQKHLAPHDISRLAAIQTKADRMTSICMQNKGYRLTDRQVCSTELLPFCFRPTRPIDHIKDWIKAI